MLCGVSLFRGKTLFSHGGGGGGAEILLVSSSPARWATRLNRGLYPYYRSCHVFFSDMQKIRGGLLKTNFGDDMGEGGLVRGTVAFIELIFGN